MKLSNEQINELNEYVRMGYVNKQRHPTYPITIYKYTKICQFSMTSPKEWSDLLLMCRGLILDDDYNIVAKGFNKFFNYEEHSQEYLDSFMKPDKSIMVCDKCDGTMIIMFWYNDRWNFSTNGSFNEIYTDEARRIYDELYATNELNKSYSYLFEMVSPDNRIVRKYKSDDMIYLGQYDINNLKFKFDPDIIFNQCAYVAYIDHSMKYNDDNLLNKKFEVKSIYDINDDIHVMLLAKYIKNCVDDIKSVYSIMKYIGKIIENDERCIEGFIIRNTNNQFIKIKFDKYKQMHKMLTGLSEKNILEGLYTGKPISKNLTEVPDEFFNWIKTIESSYIERYNQILKHINDIVDNIKSTHGNELNGKELYDTCLSYDTDLTNIILNMYKKNSITKNNIYGDVIWKMINDERKEINKENGHMKKVASLLTSKHKGI